MFEWGNLDMRSNEILEDAKFCLKIFFSGPKHVDGETKWFLNHEVLILESSLMCFCVSTTKIEGIIYL